MEELRIAKRSSEHVAAFAVVVGRVSEERKFLARTRGFTLVEAL